MKLNIYICSKLSFDFSQTNPNPKFSFNYLEALSVFPCLLDWLLRALTFRCAVRYYLDFVFCFDLILAITVEMHTNLMTNWEAHALVEVELKAFFKW